MASTRKPLFLNKTFFPKQEEHKLEQVGDLKLARKRFFEEKPSNLYFLLDRRYTWMNEYIEEGAKGLEVGCGAGFSKAFIENKDFLLTDYTDDEWLYMKVDALNMPFEDSSMDYIVASNMIHHLSKPYLFFEECSRVLKPGGKMLIQDVNGSFFMRLILKMLNHEGFSYEVNPFDKTQECCDPENLWAGNNVINNLLFDDMKKFESEFPFKTRKKRYTEFLIFLISGGVTAKSPTIMLPKWMLRSVETIDKVLTGLLPGTFALQIQLVLENDK